MATRRQHRFRVGNKLKHAGTTVVTPGAYQLDRKRGNKMVLR